MQGGDHLGGNPWLRDKAKNFAAVNGRGHHIQGFDACDEDAGGGRLDSSDAAQQVGAHHVRHVVVGNDDSEFAVHCQMQGLLSTRGGHGMVACPCHQILKHFENDRVVIDG